MTATQLFDIFKKEFPERAKNVKKFHSKASNSIIIETNRHETFIFAANAIGSNWTFGNLVKKEG